MKIKVYITIFACFILLLVSGCALSSSKGGDSLILYAITERTEDLVEEIGTSLYTVSEVDGEPKKIYEVDAPQQLYPMYSEDGSKVVILVWEMVDRPPSIVPGASYTLVTMDPDGGNAISWYEARQAKTLLFAGTWITAQYSPDGKRFLYTQPASEDNNEVKLYTARADGTDKQLIDQGQVLAAEFTPEGNRLLVTHRIVDVANKKTIYEVYYVDADGGEPEVVWSSQEKGIVSVSAKIAGKEQVLLAVGTFSTGEVALSMASADFEEITPITRFPGTRASMLTLSPDGKNIALERYGDTCQLFSVIEVATGEIHDVSCWMETPFQFDSNGRWLVIALGDYGDFSHPGTNSMLLEPDGDLIEMFAPPEYTRVALSPRGERLVYWLRDADTREMCLNLRDLEGDEVTTLEATCVDGTTSFPGILTWK